VKADDLGGQGNSGRFSPLVTGVALSLGTPGGVYLQLRNVVESKRSPIKRNPWRASFKRRIHDCCGGNFGGCDTIDDVF
jgi:hypothetical protein